MTKSKTTIQHTNEILKLNPFVYYENIDFLTIRLPDGLEILNTLNGLCENSNEYLLSFGFKITFFDWGFGKQMKYYKIIDRENNIICNIKIKQPTEKKNRNVYTAIEFDGLFFKAYFDYFDYILSIFDIDRNKNDIVKRIDYCIDWGNLEVKDFIKYYKNKMKKEYGVGIGSEPTYKNIKLDRHELVLYNKKLDILEKNKHKTKVDGKNIYKDYITQDFPITRLEYRKKSRAIRELTNNSINALFKYSKQYALDYFNKFYDLDIIEVYKETSTFERFKRPERKDILVTNITHKKISLYLSMASAYMDNYTAIKTESLFFEKLYEKYGDRILDFFITKHLNNTF
ncbi:MAG: hypothetical protein QM490_02615 [Candidatus Gracilibacteria bacterium]